MASLRNLELPKLANTRRIEYKSMLSGIVNHLKNNSAIFYRRKFRFTAFTDNAVRNLIKDFHFQR